MLIDVSLTIEHTETQHIVVKSKFTERALEVFTETKTSNTTETPDHGEPVNKTDQACVLPPLLPHSPLITYPSLARPLKFTRWEGRQLL